MQLASMGPAAFQCSELNACTVQGTFGASDAGGRVGAGSGDAATCISSCQTDTGTVGPLAALKVAYRYRRWPRHILWRHEGIVRRSDLIHVLQYIAKHIR